MLEKDILKKTKQLLTEHGEEITELRVVLKKQRKALLRRKFAGYDRDYLRGMIYRVNKYDDNDGRPILIIDELTVHPALRASHVLDLDLHRRDIDVSSINLKFLAERLSLEKEHFHFYV